MRETLRMMSQAVGHITATVAPPLYSLATGRSSKWPAFRKKILALHPYCVVTGRLATDLHHIKAFHVHPELELDPDNVRPMTRDAHFAFGHGFNWTYWQENFDAIVEDFKKHLQKSGGSEGE